MNLVLDYCWKEWRAQRGLLTAYTLLVFACLCIGLYIAPRHYWADEGFGMHALTWFVAAGVIGIVAFVVPGLVRAEFTNKDDQFVRRLPGALWPAFGGKLLFLVLATLLLPLLGLLVGEGFVTAVGGDWHGLFLWQWNGSVSLRTSDLMYMMAAALLLAPWVWAVATWMPGGRLALLGTILLGLLLGVAVFAVLRQSPHIEDGVRWWRWLWTVPLSGLTATALSWGRGRRGGGPWRSARHGLMALTVMSLPGWAWLGERVYHYHHPDMANLAEMQVYGLTRDHRYALAQVSERQNWQPVTVRLDLANGTAEKVAGVNEPLTPETVRRAPLTWHATQRYWRTWSNQQQFLFDLETGERRAVGADENYRMQLPDDLKQKVWADQHASSVLMASGGVRVTFDDGDIVFTSPDGLVERAVWPHPKSRSYYPAGHAVRFWVGGGEPKFYSFEKRACLQVPDAEYGYMLGTRFVYLARAGRSHEWRVHVDGEGAVPCEPLHGKKVLGVLDDHSLLACRETRKASPEPLLFRFWPATGEVENLVVPDGTPWAAVDPCAPMHQQRSLLARDPAGWVWLRCRSGDDGRMLRVQPESGKVSAARLPATGTYRRTVQLMAWDQLPRVLVQDDLEVALVDIASGDREVLFGRARR